MRLLEIAHWRTARSHRAGDGTELLPYLLVLASQKSTAETTAPICLPVEGPWQPSLTSALLYRALIFSLRRG